MSKKKKKKPYLPNNWHAYANCPDEYFESLPIEQFFNWIVDGWEIPSSVHCIIREEDEETGTIKEYTYSRHNAAQDRVNKIMDKGNSFVVCAHDGLHYLKPKEIVEDYDDPLA